MLLCDNIRIEWVNSCSLKSSSDSIWCESLKKCMAKDTGEITVLNTVLEELQSVMGAVPIHQEHPGMPSCFSFVCSLKSLTIHSIPSSSLVHPFGEWASLHIKHWNSIRLRSGMYSQSIQYIILCPFSHKILTFENYSWTKGCTIGAYRDNCCHIFVVCSTLLMLGFCPMAATYLLCTLY